MSWIKVSMEASAAAVPAVTDAMEALGALAVTTQPEPGEAVLEPAPGEQPLAARNRVTGLFDADRDPQRLEAALREAAGGTWHAGPPRVETLEDSDWEHAWRQQAVAREFGDGLWVVPRDAPAPRGARAVVRLDPGLAFGTGSHPTTALCLEWLAGGVTPGCSVIDYGCGSGVLAVAAAALGAGAVYAWDHDPQALEATRANAAENGVRVHVTDDPPPADVLVANILANALHALAPRFADLVRPGGAIALSGILPDQAAALAGRYAHAFRMHSPRTHDGWVLLDGTRSGGGTEPGCS